MGNKLSAVHGVKSEDYFRPGNGINEIWFGDVEILSRLPFGDSDLSQAAWPVGEWPKIPWHNFIIPWKRSIELDNGGGDTAVDAAVRLGVDRYSQKDGALAPWTAVVLLALVVLGAWYLPVWLRGVTPSPRGVALEKGGAVRRWYYAIRTCLATVALGLGVVVGVLDFHAVHRLAGFGDGRMLVLLKAFWAAGAAFAFFCAARAVGSLCVDWGVVWRRVDGDVHNPLLDKQLPVVAVSYFERQRRP